MNTATIMGTLSRRLDEVDPVLARLDDHYAGRGPLSFLSPKARLALGDRLRTLGVNFPRLVVDSLAERLAVEGFRVGPDAPADADLWNLWQANGLDEGAEMAHTDALVYGRSFVSVWAGDDPKIPRIAIESPRQMLVTYAPGTRRPVAALKRWKEDDRGHAWLFLPGEVVRFQTDRLGEGTLMPPDGWRTVERRPNPLGVVPVVAFVNRPRTLDTAGTSEMADVLDISDALNKVMSDVMVTAEYHARPRRWITGLELEEDEAGEPIPPPFTEEAGRVWQAEPAEAKFGQFDAARLDGYADMIKVLTSQIGAMSGLPPHYLSVNSDQPASADAIRSAEASLVSRARGRQRSFGGSWENVMRLALLVRDGVERPDLARMETLWRSPETRTRAQDVDAATKLAGIGMPFGQTLDDLGYSPTQQERIRDLRRADALDTAALDLARRLA